MDIGFHDVLSLIFCAAWKYHQKCTVLQLQADEIRQHKPAKNANPLAVSTEHLGRTGRIKMERTLRHFFSVTVNTVQIQEGGRKRCFTEPASQRPSSGSEGK
jgi:hypothetical protein